MAIDDVILYARASTKDKQTPEHQMAELEAAAARRGWRVVARFIERESGKRTDRPRFGEAMALLRARRARVFMATELSRFGRSTRHLLEVSSELERLGADLVATRQELDTSTPAGRLMFTVLAAVAQFEADMTRERVAAGVAFAMDKRGGAWGAPREMPPAAVRLARELRAAGRSWTEVSDELAAAGHAQPARDRGARRRPARPWPVSNLRAALRRPEGL